MQNITTDGSVAAGIVIGSGAACNHRTIPCEPAPVLIVPVAGVPPQVIQKDEVRDPESTPRIHTTCNPFVYEAMRLLKEHGYETSRPAVKNAPVGIVALKGRDVLKIAVIRSRKPVPDAKTLRELYPAKFSQMCAMAKPAEYRTMIWISSPLIGWRYYLVETGGIRRDWDFTKLMEQ